MHGPPTNSIKRAAELGYVHYVFQTTAQTHTHTHTRVRGTSNTRQEECLARTRRLHTPNKPIATESATPVHRSGRCSAFGGRGSACSSPMMVSSVKSHSPSGTKKLRTPHRSQTCCRFHASSATATPSSIPLIGDRSTGSGGSARIGLRVRRSRSASRTAEAEELLHLLGIDLFRAVEDIRLGAQLERQLVHLNLCVRVE